MSNGESSRVWVVRGGDNNELAAQVKHKGAVAVGWVGVGDVSGQTREGIAGMLEDAKPGSASANAVGQLFRFANKIKPGDYVLTYEKATRLIHVSRCTGPYRYDPAVFGDSYAHVRPVEYVGTIPRSYFSVTARNTLGSVLTVFRADGALSFIAPGLAGGAAPADASDETLAEPGVWADEIDGQARGQILEALDNIEHHDFQVFVCGLLEAMGYRTRVGGKGADGGVDFLAYKDAFGLESPRIKGQTKNQKPTAGIPEVGYLHGVLGGGESGLFVCTGGFTKDAMNAAFVKSGRVALVDGVELLDLVLAHYDRLSANAKALLPLRRIYVPEKPAS